jgi:3-phenylpropionate/trans-cinnamate dioxygenase ferredoxin subunit
MTVVAKFSELESGTAHKVIVDGVAVAVVRIEDEVFAIADTCSHSEASLAEGDITDFKIECWLHGAEFDLRTGKALTPPATAPVHKYSVSVDGDSVTIEK